MTNERVTKVADAAHQISIDEKIKRGEKLQDYDLDFLERQKIAADEARIKRKELLGKTRTFDETVAALAAIPRDDEADRRLLLEHGIDPDNLPGPVTIDEYIKGVYGGKV